MAGGRRTHRRPASLLAALALVIAVAGCGSTPVVTPSPPANAASLPAPQDGSSSRAQSARRRHPVTRSTDSCPYWEMDAGIAAHLASTPLTTIGLFSVTHTANGSLRTNAPGYQTITGDIGKQVIAEAHDRGTRVEIVYTSFGLARNARLFGNIALQDKVIASLVAVRRRGGRRRRQRRRRGARLAAHPGLRGVPHPPPGRAGRRAPGRPGLRGDPGQHARRRDGGGRGRGKRRPDLHDGLRLPHGRLGPGRDVAHRPARRRREGHPVVARPLRRPRGAAGASCCWGCRCTA